MINLDNSYKQDVNLTSQINEISDQDKRKESFQSNSILKQIFAKKNSIKSEFSTNNPNIQRNFLEDFQIKQNQQNKNTLKKVVFYSEIEDRDNSEAFYSHSEQFQKQIDFRQQKQKNIDEYLFKKQQKMELIQCNFQNTKKPEGKNLKEFNQLLQELNLKKSNLDNNNSITQLVNHLKDLNFVIHNSTQTIAQSFVKKKDENYLEKNLHHFFSCLQIDSDLFIQMNSKQKDFFLGLLKNKFFLSSDLKGIKFKSKIRRENKSKYIVKKGIKFLFKKFKQKNDYFIRGKKILNEEEFYLYYFKCLESEKFPIESVYLPGSKISQISMKNPTFKTIKIDYLKMIFQADQFKKDFLQYLEEDFLKTQIEERNQKISSIIEKYEKNISTSKIKLPWTNNELLNAKKLLIETIEKISNQFKLKNIILKINYQHTKTYLQTISKLN